MDVVQIASALETFEPVNGRLMLKHSQWGHLIIDDTYNANPGSFKVAVDVLKECEGERWLIAGDMAELGEETKALHHTLGEQAREAGIDRLYAYGEQSREAWLAFNGQGGHFEAQTKLITALREAMQAYRPESLSLLVKGSRKMRMELIVSALQNEEERVESLNTSGVEA
jgi:UDP-N-acetylmuramoyl-tripeptide--D-alanyl-D-alanine ligase